MAYGAAVLPMEAEIDFMRELMLRLWLELQETAFALLWHQIDKKLSARLTVVPSYYELPGTKVDI